MQSVVNWNAKLYFTMFRSFLILFCFIPAIICVDYYELLGIQKDADSREIRKAFKRLALKYHPDKHKGHVDAHEKFIEINKAYEVLKDEEMRKKYDLYGEDGLKDNFGKSWQGNYRSWNYYYESFGIYDDDVEITTLSRSDFDRSVLQSSDVWFVNFYSPQCSHCHLLAPAWRQLARELQGVVQIGAVNCEEDWMLCRQQNINAYPTLMLYPQRRKYDGSREAEDMIHYVLKILPYKVIELTSMNYVAQISDKRFSSLPWLIILCKDPNDCLPREELKKMGIMLEHLVNVAKVDYQDWEKVCELIPCKSRVTYFERLSTAIPKTNLKKVLIHQLDPHEIVKEVLHLLPEPKEISSQDLEEIKKKLEEKNSLPWLIQFTKDKESSTEKDIDLKRLKSFLPEVLLGHFNCYNQESTCSSLYIFKFPSFLLFKPGGTHEFHYGSSKRAYDVARFTKEALASQVHTLNPENFPNITESEELWFIDFFAPWCPPCMQFLPEWRKASSTSGDLVKFGTVDCSVHHQLCRNHDINSYPSAILYKQSVGHKFHGSHSKQHVEEFIQDILHPVVISLSPSSFEEIQNKKSHDIWAVDFFAPWCGPCQQLAPQWRKVAKMLKAESSIHIGEVDCEAHQHFCRTLNINTFPTIRLFPMGSTSTDTFFTYNGWSRDASSLQAWIYSFMNSKVPTFSEADFHSALAEDEPLLIEFFAPWCSHCQTFAPVFDKISQNMDGYLKTGKVNCDDLPNICRLAGIRAYPTVIFYKGTVGSDLRYRTYISAQDHHLFPILKFYGFWKFILY